MAVRIAYRQPQTGSQGFARTKKVFGGQVALATSDVNQTTNSVSVMRVPAGFVLTGLYAVAASILGASITINLGDSGSANRFLSASNFGQSTTATTSLATTGSYYQFTQDTEILLIPAVAGTAGGNVTVYFEGFMANP